MFPGTLLINSSSPFFVSPRAPVTTGTTTVFVCHVLSISISRSWYFDSSSNILMDVFLSDGMATSIGVQISSLLLLLLLSLKHAAFLKTRPQGLFLDCRQSCAQAKSSRARERSLR